MYMNFSLAEIAVNRNIVPNPVKSSAERIKIMFIAVFPEPVQCKVDAVRLRQISAHVMAVV